MSPRIAAVADADCRICRHTVVAVHSADAPRRSLADIKQDIAAQFRLALSDLSVTMHGERQYLVRFEDPAVRVMVLHKQGPTLIARINWPFMHLVLWLSMMLTLSRWSLLSLKLVHLSTLALQFAQSSMVLLFSFLTMLNLLPLVCLLAQLNQYLV
jgi:hypothetical protein